MLIRATAAAMAAAISSSPVYSQTMSRSVSTTVNAAAAIAQNGDPLPRGKAEDVGMSSERLGEIAKRLNTDVAAGRIPGAVVAIARKGKLVYFESFGFRDKQAGVAMTRDTIFNIASMTKPMVALAALQLQERGLLLIDDPLAKYFPQFAKMEVAELNASGDTITGKVPARAADHAAPPDDAHLRADLRRARQHGRAQALSGRQRHCGRDNGRRGIHGRTRQAAAAESTGRRVGLRLRPRCAWPRGREGFRADARAVFPGQHLQAARHDRHAVQYPARQGRALRQGAADGPRHRARAIDHAGAYAAAEVRVRRRMSRLDGGRLHALRARALEQGRLWRDAHPRAQDRRIHADEPARPGGEEPDRECRPVTRRLRLRARACAVRTDAARGRLLGSAGDFNWPGASGTNWWADPKEELAVVFMAHSPGPIRWHYRQVINALVYQAIVD